MQRVRKRLAEEGTKEPELRVRPFAWIKNTVRNRLKRGMAGRLLVNRGAEKPIGHVRIVSATRMDEATFWKNSATGQSLALHRGDKRLSFDIAFSNKAGLPAVYNAAGRRAGPKDALLFIHDDIWLDDPEWIDKLLLSLRRFDVVGLAGNKRRVKGQPGWLYTAVDDDGKFWLDAGTLSGAVRHGKTAKGKVTYFGPSPASVELLDGLFIAARHDVLLSSRVTFDERFDFHFYDLDFCRTARAAGLSVGTWPIMVTHQSGGAFNSPGWRSGLKRYLDKWKG